jgi:hypothetical protein
MWSIAVICQSKNGILSTHCLHFVRTSHLLDLLPGELGRMLFSSSLSFGHLVTNAELGRPAVIAATSCKRGCIVRTLQACHAAMLHGMMVCGCYVYRLLACM